MFDVSAAAAVCHAGVRRRKIQVYRVTERAWYLYTQSWRLAIRDAVVSCSFKQWRWVITLIY